MKTPRPIRSPREPRTPRAPRAPRSGLPAPGSSPRPPGVLARPRANRTAGELVMIANGTLPWPVDLTDADERTIEQVRRANAQRDTLSRKAKR